MRQKKSFAQLVLNVYAAIMRVIFPRYCVKCLTLASRKNAEKFLPGAKKELQLIETLGLDKQELKSRKWSLDTRLELIKRRNFALISKATTLDELETVLETGLPDKIARVMSVVTPSSALMKRLLEGDDHVELLVYLADKVPTVFGVVEPWEILGVEKGNSCPVLNPRWEIASALVASQSKWAVPFMTELWNIPPRQLEDKGRDLFNRYFDVAMKNNEDISKLISYIYVIFPECYSKFYKQIFSYKREVVIKCIKAFYPQIIEKLELDENINDIYSLKSVSEEMSNEAKDAYCWLYVGVMLSKWGDVFDVVSGSLDWVKTKVSVPVFQSVISRLVHNAATTADINALLWRCDLTTEQKTVLFARLVEHTCANLEGYYPFKSDGWTPELTEKAIRQLAEDKMLPIDRLNELSEDLQSVAHHALEVQSQLDLIKEDKKALASGIKFHAEVEAYVYSHNSSIDRQLLVNYAEEHNLSDEGFKAVLLSDKRYMETDGLMQTEIIQKVAKKFGLAEKRYCELMQSQYSYVAPYVKEFVQSSSKEAQTNG